MTITCFDIGGSSIKAAIADGQGHLQLLGRAPTPLEDFEAFVAVIDGFIRAGGAPADAPIAISITGVIDPQSGIATVANIPCIDGRPLAADLGSMLGRSVQVANDADCFALAEALNGAGKGHRVVFGVILGTGVGGGIVVDGRILPGASGIAGEWGHGTIVATEVSVAPFHIPHFPCGCGLKGCADTIGGARGLERLHRHLHGLDLTSAAIIDNWDRGEASASQTIDLYIELLAPPLALVVNVVGPDSVPVGGGLANSSALLERLDSAVRSRTLRQIDTPLIVPAQVGVDAGLLGAAGLGAGK